MESLHRQVLPFLLRRVKEDVLQDLPPKIIQDYHCDLSPLQVRGCGIGGGGFFDFVCRYQFHTFAEFSTLKNSPTFCVKQLFLGFFSSLNAFDVFIVGL